MFMSKPSTHIYGTLEFPIFRGCAAFIREGNKSRSTSPVKHFLKRVLVGSFLLTGIGCGILLLFTEITSVFLLMASLGVLGFGLGGNGTIFMKVVLSGLTPQEAGAGTGTYGLFRDLAAPFGVAVFVPLFANQITGRIAAGTAESAAAVSSIHFLAIAELLCVALGIIAVAFLPKRIVIKEN